MQIKNFKNMIFGSIFLSLSLQAVTFNENSVVADISFNNNNFQYHMSSSSNPAKENGIIFIDSDLNQNSGLNRYGLGSDYLIQNGFLFRYTGNGSNWSWEFVSEVGNENGVGDYSGVLSNSLIGNSIDANVLIRYFDSNWQNMDSSTIHRVTGEQPPVPVGNVNISEDSINIVGNGGNSNLTLAVSSTSNPAKVNGILYIDSDQDSSSGYRTNGLGIDFLVQNGNLFTYTGNGSNWSWEFSSVVGEDRGDNFTLSLSSDQLRGASNISIFARYYDSSWNWRTLDQTNIHQVQISDAPPAGPATVVYEDFEDGNLDGWSIGYDPYGDAHMSIAPEGSFNASRHCGKFEGTARGQQNLYIYPIHDAQRTKLSVDLGGFRGHNRVHYLIGVYANTTKGLRIMTWDSFYNYAQNGHPEHPGAGDAPKIADYGNIWLIYPSPVEHVRGFGYAPQDEIDTLRVDLNEELHRLEPDNDIVSIDSFIAGGGYLDNITLSR